MLYFLKGVQKPRKLGGGFKYFFTPTYLGKMVSILTSIFFNWVGWNHQLENLHVLREAIFWFELQLRQPDLKPRLPSSLKDPTVGSALKKTLPERNIYEHIWDIDMICKGKLSNLFKAVAVGFWKFFFEASIKNGGFSG